MQFSLEPDRLLITWSDDTLSSFPYLWLRDTDPAGFHPQTGERTFELTSVPEGVMVSSAVVDKDMLVINWPDQLEPDAVAAYYAAYRCFMTMTRVSEYMSTYRLAAGEMVVFDNRRILHGRDAFEPGVGHRHLHGCYVDRADWDSRLRVLSRDADQYSI